MPVSIDWVQRALPSCTDIPQIQCGRVIGLEYFILMDGPRGTGIHVRLKLSGDDSPLCGKEFVVDLEPDMVQ